MNLKNSIAGTLSALGTTTLQAVNPSTKEILPGVFAEATEAEVDRAAQAAYIAWQAYKNTSGVTKARLLRTIAENIEALGDTLVQRSMAESGLPEARIKGERGRTCGQLRLFADVVEEGSWVRATIDTAMPDRKPLPRVDIRKMYQALGPVAIFGASNFPLAFSTAGGDTVSALAAGCPVVVKGHPAHPGTHSMVSEAIAAAVASCDLPPGVFSAVNGGIPVGTALVQHPQIKAVGFTGSLGGGRAILRATYERAEPIPVYAEMGSVNPIFVMADQLEGDVAALANMLASSINMGAGQFCTNPGVLVVDQSPHREVFIRALHKAFAELRSFTMLTEGINKNYISTREKIASQSHVEVLYAAPADGSWEAQPTLACTTAATFVGSPDLHHEVFGPFSMLVLCEEHKDMLAVANSLEGQLTTTILCKEDSAQQHLPLIDVLREKTGRLLFNGVPTGVEVGYAMHHGGPFPAASTPMYTSVGTDAILRFVRPICLQNTPEGILPPELKNKNPLGIWRMVNGRQSKEALE